MKVEGETAARGAEGARTLSKLSGKRTSIRPNSGEYAQQRRRRGATGKSLR